MEELQQNAEFKRALAFHQNGNVLEAKNIYLGLLSLYSNNTRLLNNLAIIEFQHGHFESGLDYVEKSLGIDSNQFAAYGNRGAALFALGRLDEAYLDYSKAITLNKNYAEAYYNLGILHEKSGRHEEALRDYDKAIEIRPNYTNAYNNRGNVLKVIKRFEEALSNYEHAIKLNPRHAEAHYNRGVIFKELKSYQEALSSYQQAISLKSNYVDAYNNCGSVLIELGRFEDALAYYQKAIQLNPDYAYAYTGQGIAFMELKRFDEAFASFEKAIVYNLRTSKDRQNKNTRVDDPGTTTDADVADAFWNKAILKILLGEYEEGWCLYEYRRHRIEQKESYPDYKQPLWLGQQPINGRVLYIYPEQGLGDFIQFCRYIPLVEKLGAKVILSVPAQLYPVIKTMGLNAKIIMAGEKIDAFDLHCPIMSLPLAFKTKSESIPNTMPYFFADKEKKNTWEDRLNKASPQLKVGLVWSGSKEHKKDHDRSIRLEQLGPILSLPIAFYSLQKEIRNQDKITISTLNQIQQFSDELIDFSDTAALVDCLDLVITVDTSVAHLAGAMAKNVWILISYLPDYRWMLDRDDTPWYPQLRYSGSQMSGIGIA
ncbi:tetratricopeptide repeat protein [Methylophilus sp. Leaf408]|uniref:tetratricopeptide repeat protein n=1 Tax=Methylophilus sp. Leaf408 TaxID=2876561 RepID=UPI001E5864A1|nr:tetratricopeptide repeat protein [Methylophilus sp. Leaf408]